MNLIAMESAIETRSKDEMDTVVILSCRLMVHEEVKFNHSDIGTAQSSISFMCSIAFLTPSDFLRVLVDRIAELAKSRANL